MKFVSELTTDLQRVILKHIYHTSDADYKSIIEATARNRITILQSLRPLIRRRLVREEKQDPYLQKSKSYFKLTDKGMFYAISSQLSSIDEICRVPSLPNILNVYDKFAKEGFPLRLANRKERIHVFATDMIRLNQFDDNGKCILHDEKDLWKYLIRKILVEQLEDKYFNLENIFSEGGTWMNLAQDFGPPGGRAFEDILKKIRSDLDKFIDIFPTENT